MPDAKQFFAEYIFCTMCEDLLYHFVHRLLHWGPFYTYIHKIHHSYETTIGIATEYCHPIEYVIAGFYPTSLAALLLRKKLHIVSVMMFTMAKTFESTESHSGYHFAWSPFKLFPFANPGNYHDYHHTHNVGNFSS